LQNRDFKGLLAVLLDRAAENFACGNIFEKQTEMAIVNFLVYRMFLRYRCL